MNQNINIREFLKECPESELKSKGILRGSTKILQGTSVAPLIELMKAKCVLRVEFTEIKWFLESNGQFSNPFSPEAKSGNLDDILSKGSLFRQTNKYINPYYTGSKSLSEGSVPEDTKISDEGGFAYEEGLKKYLVKNISLIESGMSLYSDAENDIDGIEFRVDENKNIKNIIHSSLKISIENSSEMTNQIKSSLFVSNLGKMLNEYCKGLFQTNYISVDSKGKKTSGEWMLDISVTKQVEVTEEFNGKVIKKLINTNLIWAVESETSTSTIDFCMDFGKLLCVNSENYLYLNGLNHSTPKKSEEYVEKRIDTVTKLLQDMELTENLYYGFFPTPGKTAGNDSIWAEILKGNYSHLGLRLFKFQGKVFVEI